MPLLKQMCMSDNFDARGIVRLPYRTEEFGAVLVCISRTRWARSIQGRKGFFTAADR